MVSDEGEICVMLTTDENSGGAVNHLLTVREVQGNGRIVSEGGALVACRYVRCELRQLTNEDREAFLSAMQVFYTAPEGGGRDGGMGFSHYQHFAEFYGSQVKVWVPVRLDSIRGMCSPKSICCRIGVVGCGVLVRRTPWLTTSNDLLFTSSLYSCCSHSPSDRVPFRSPLPGVRFHHNLAYNRCEG